MLIHGARLYPLLFAGVLALAACGGEKTENGSREPSNPTSDGTVDGSAAPVPPPNASPSGTAVLFFGDSITAGLGVDPDSSYTAVLQRMADAEGIDARMINAGLSGETSAGGLRRIGWLLRQPVDIFVLELGGNDGLRGIALDETRQNLLGIIDSVRVFNPSVQVVVAGMMIPPNLGPDYTTGFRELYPDVARSRDAMLIPFLLEGVGGVDSLMQNDGIHPTAGGHRVMAATVWEVLEPLLRS